jgi:hypothetical protein
LKYHNIDNPLKGIEQHAQATSIMKAFERGKEATNKRRKIHESFDLATFQQLPLVSRLGPSRHWSRVPLGFRRKISLPKLFEGREVVFLVASGIMIVSCNVYSRLDSAFFKIFHSTRT